MEKLTPRLAVLLVWFWLTAILGSLYLGLLLEPMSQAEIQREAVQGEVAASGEERLADYTLWLTIFTGALSLATVGLGVFNYLLWRETRDAGRRATEMHADEQRPWLSLNIETNPSLVWSACIATAEYDLQVLNVGRKPAFDVRHYHDLLRNLPQHPVANFDLFVSERIKEHSADLSGSDDRRRAVIFPGDRPPNLGFQIDESGIGVPMTIFPDRLYLFLCICYRSEPQGPVLHTAIAYVMLLKQPASAETTNDGTMVLGPRDTTVPEVTRFTAIGLSSAA